MRKKIATFFLSALLLFSCVPTVLAAPAYKDLSRWGQAAEALWEDGLFLGTGASFDLDKPMLRSAGVTMVVRLLGKEDQALAGTWDLPFTDVPDWAVPYVGYAYENGITNGTSATTFGASAAMTANQYLTFLLRVLGYDDTAGDFSWDKAGEKAAQIGLAQPEDLAGEAFLRGQAALVSYHALSLPKQGTDQPLREAITLPGRPDGSLPAWLSQGQTAGDVVRQAYVAAGQRRDEILAAPTDIVKSTTWQQGKTYTGTAYYLSNDGDDRNDGKSPQTPWATLERLSKASPKPGDAVFFHRGDVWYAGEEYWGDVMWYGCVRGFPGVTYSAYGEGEKPVISGSLPDLADGSKWTLYATGPDGAKIWRYQEQLHSVSGILMEEGTLWSTMLLPGWNGQTYTHADGTPFTVENGLTEDLTSFHAIDLTGRPADTKIENEGLTGPLYLRCDRGNPGEVFHDIQFVAGGIGFGTEREFGQGLTVDNLSVQYFSQLGINLGGYQGWKGTLVQNCEIGWCGGMTQAYVESQRFGQGKATYSGGAIQMSGCDNRALDNYIHDCDSKAFVVVIHDRGADVPTVYENLEMRGNLIENSATALQVMSCLRDEGSDREGRFQDLTFADNYVMHTAEGWMTDRLEAADIWEEYGIVSGLNFTGVKDGILDNVRVEDNVFACGHHALVAIKTSRNNYPTFTGNTYIQYAGQLAVDAAGRRVVIDQDAAAGLAGVLGDTTATVGVLG